MKKLMGLCFIMDSFLCFYGSMCFSFKVVEVCVLVLFFSLCADIVAAAGEG
jgi:hypothetical protein